jgi:hypothetical protein
MLDQLDKDINTFAMRCREWYGWHFPELVKVVSDNHTYAKLVTVIRDKSKLTEASLPTIEAIVGDAAIAKQVRNSTSFRPSNNFKTKYKIPICRSWTPAAAAWARMSASWIFSTSQGLLSALFLRPTSASRFRGISVGA